METNGDVIHSVGRPCYLDDRDSNGNFSNPKILEFFNAIQAGDFVTGACDYSGIDNSQVTRWLEYAKSDLKKGLTTKYTEFCTLLKRKQSEAKLFHLMKVRNAKDWKASAWYLERKYSKEFSVNYINENNNDNNGAVEIQWDIPKIDNDTSK